MVAELNTGYTKVESCQRAVHSNGFVFVNTISSWGYTKSPVILLVPDFSSMYAIQNRRIPAPRRVKKGNVQNVF